jgi:hypothetical protein
VRPERLDVPLTTGTIVHHGINLLLSGRGVEDAVGESREKYLQAVKDRQLEINLTEQQEYVIAEQIALTEAHIRLAHLRIIPRLLEKYGLIASEKELLNPLTPEITLMSRPDGILYDRGQHGVYTLSWKTAADPDDRTLEDAQHDDQGLSESWSVERWLAALFDYPGAPLNPPPTVDGVVMIWLHKGRRYESPKGSGVYISSSPLIRGYRKYRANGSPRFAWSWDYLQESAYPCKNCDGSGEVPAETKKGTGKCSECKGKGWTEPGPHVLGNTWQKFDVWEIPDGVKHWVEALHVGLIQPEAGNCLEMQYSWPAPYYRQPGDIEDWVKEVRHQETRIAGAIADIRYYEQYYRENAAYPPVMLRSILDETFPHNRRACSYPKRCPAYDICWRSPVAKEEPIGNGYRWREPHHQAEVERFEGGKE